MLIANRAKVNKKLRINYLHINEKKVFLLNLKKITPMKKMLLLLAFVGFAFTASAQGAKIEFVAKDNTVDYGTIYRDTDSGLRTFEFKNTGDAPLIITNVQSTCGCTVPSKPTEPIMPGKTGKIDVKYNMSPGPIRKTITVESNATNVEGGRIALKIKGEVLVKEEVNVLEKKKGIISSDN
jgi:hypothetical protein